MTPLPSYTFIVKSRSKWILVALVITCVNSVHAAPVSTPGNSDETRARDKQRSDFLVGHNLTPTSYTLPAGETTVGTYAVGVGVTDNFMLATSPFIWLGYNMANIGGRVAVQTDSFIDRICLEGLYFNTLQMSFANYEQESLFGRLTATSHLGRTYRVHMTFGYQYFFNDAHPFSLRPNPFTRDPITISVGALHEFRFSEKFGILAETAILGLNYMLPYGHFGLSAFWKSKALTIQAGLSASIRGSADISAGAVAQYKGAVGTPMGTLIQSEVWGDDYVPLNARHVMVHPEVQLQFEF